MSDAADGVAVCSTGLLISGRGGSALRGRVEDFERGDAPTAALANDVGSVLVFVMVEGVTV